MRRNKSITVSSDTQLEQKVNRPRASFTLRRREPTELLISPVVVACSNCTDDNHITPLLAHFIDLLRAAINPARNIISLSVDAAIMAKSILVCTGYAAGYVLRFSVRSLAWTSYQTCDDKNDNYHGTMLLDFRWRAPDFLGALQRYPGWKVLGRRPHLTAKFESTEFPCKRGGTQKIYATRLYNDEVNTILNELKCLLKYYKIRYDNNVLNWSQTFLLPQT